MPQWSLPAQANIITLTLASMFTKRSYLFICLMACGYWGMAQKQPPRPAINKQQDTTKPRRYFDSSIFADANVLTQSDYLAAIEKTFQLFNKVPVVISSFTELDNLQQELVDDDSALSIMKDRVSQTDRTLNIRNLQMFQTLLNELKTKTASSIKELQTYDDQMDALKREVLELRRDTILRHVFRDSALRMSLMPQLKDLRKKRSNVDSLVKLYTDVINRLKATAAANFILTDELVYQTNALQKNVRLNAFKKERRYIWEARSGPVRTMPQGFRRSIQGEQKLVAYYFSDTRNQRLLLLVTGLVFFCWVWYNFKSLQRLNKQDAVHAFDFTYISPYPVAVSLVFMLNLAPLFDLHAPAIYVESVQLLLMLVLTWIFRKQLPKTWFALWCVFIVLFLFLTFSRLLGLSVTGQRWFTLCINTVSFILGLFVLLRNKSKALKHKLFFFAGILYLLFNLLAIPLNLFGRVTLMQILGSTAVYAFAQTVGLWAFVRICIEAFLLQIEASRVRKKYPDYFEHGPIERSLTKLVGSFAAFIWLVVLATNLNIYSMVWEWLGSFLVTKRTLGSFSFSISGIILFLGIIWIANFLQKYIAYFFGDVGDDAAFDNKGQRSRLLITRLILLSLGFLLAVAASGLPIDKITVVLGALGVGIGLGLQSIVNNFVSGIILIFDRPLRIGDVVELGSNKGRIKEIGIRSSTLLTDEGAEVIIPNGDVLSHNIVNWTLSNNHIRINMVFKVEKPFDEAQAATTIKETILSNKDVHNRKEPMVLVNHLNAQSADIKVYYWCSDVTKVEQINSEVYAAVYRKLEESGVNVL